MRILTDGMIMSFPPPYLFSHPSPSREEFNGRNQRKRVPCHILLLPLFMPVLVARKRSKSNAHSPPLSLPRCDTLTYVKVAKPASPPPPPLVLSPLLFSFQRLTVIKKLREVGVSIPRRSSHFSLPPLLFRRQHFSGMLHWKMVRSPHHSSSSFFFLLPKLSPLPGFVRVITQREVTKLVYDSKLFLPLFSLPSSPFSRMIG